MWKLLVNYGEHYNLILKKLGAANFILILWEYTPMKVMKVMKIHVFLFHNERRMLNKLISALRELTVLLIVIFLKGTF